VGVYAKSSGFIIENLRCPIATVDRICGKFQSASGGSSSQRSLVSERKAKKVSKGSPCFMLLGDAGPWDERIHDIAKTEHRLLDDKRIRDAGPADSRTARLEAFG
jgi:hypothetical protein